MTSFQHFVNNVLNLLFPDRCAGCERMGSLFCHECQVALRSYPGTLHTMPPGLSTIMIGYVFEGPIREAIHQLKYRRQRRVARPLAGLLVEPLRAFPSESCVMMPIPMHAARLAERGFNQADILGIEVARTTAMPYTNNALVRVRATEQQAHLNARERRANMQGAFVWQAKGTPPKRVLLIDDVLTTGATMSACALALKQAGVGEVYGVALARSKPDLS